MRVTPCNSGSQRRKHGGPSNKTNVNIFPAHHTSSEQLFLAIRTFNCLKVTHFLFLGAFIADKVEFFMKFDSKILIFD